MGVQRAKAISARMHEGATPEQLVQAVEGYVQQNGGLDVDSEGRDPRRWFRPETVFKAEGFDDRVERGADPQPIQRRGKPQVKARMHTWKNGPGSQQGPTDTSGNG